MKDILGSTHLREEGTGIATVDEIEDAITELRALAIEKKKGFYMVVSEFEIDGRKTMKCRMKHSSFSPFNAMKMLIRAHRVPKAIVAKLLLEEDLFNQE